LQILRNGGSTGGWGVTILWTGGSVYVLSGTGGPWWRWTGSGWTNVGTSQPGGTPPPAGSNPPPTNAPPTISGTPATTVLQGAAYAFTPTGRDADGDTLTYTITNRPGWAAFDGATGRLSGTPRAVDLGTTSNIVIRVSDGRATTALAAFSITVVATSTGSATLSWTPPTQNSDGSTLTDLRGYRVYWGTVQGSYPNSVTLNNPGLTSHVVDQLTPATWYFVVTSLNQRGGESGYSNVASKTVR
jgi:hypothetical protein